MMHSDPGVERRICLVTSAHVSYNPRLLKEADALHQTGYAVRVVAMELEPDKTGVGPTPDVKPGVAAGAGPGPGVPRQAGAMQARPDSSVSLG